MGFFKEGVQVRVAGVSLGEAELRVLPKGGNVTSLRISCTGRWGVRYYDLTAWNERGQKGEGQAEAVRNAVERAGIRVIAFGIPREEIYQPEGGVARVQLKLTIDELWVESDGALKVVVSKTGVDDEAPMLPLELPEEVRF